MGQGAADDDDDSVQKLQAAEEPRPGQPGYNPMRAAAAQQQVLSQTIITMPGQLVQQPVMEPLADSGQHAPFDTGTPAYALPIDRVDPALPCPALPRCTVSHLLRQRIARLHQIVLPAEMGGVHAVHHAHSMMAGLMEDGDDGADFRITVDGE